MFASEIERRRIKQDGEEKLAQLATQVAHDIRSPVAALELALNGAETMGGEQREIVQSAANRIKAIANHLIEENRQTYDLRLSVQPISRLLRRIVAEKQTQYSVNAKVKIIFRSPPELESALVRVDAVHFETMVSNLVNNAIEAFDGEARVEILVSVDRAYVNVLISDAGRGISESVLERLTLRGETHGKPGGSGLGLFHAKSMMESWGGNLKIESSLGRGTLVSLSFPRIPALT